jgi:SAM-dependent methyltransferase
MRADAITCHVEGYPATIASAASEAFDSITDDYADTQVAVNAEKCDRYLVPIIERVGARRVLDAGCGVGTMVMRLCELGYDAHGFDLLENAPRWARLGMPRDRFVVTDPDAIRLPYPDGHFDFLFSFGVIEHVGTTNGHSDRRPDYAAVRTAWVRELFRVVRPGGAMFLAGPNRNFPVDTAHGLDTRASGLELWLSRRIGVSVHKTWGENFLWGYGDVRSYCAGLPCRIDALSVHGLANFSRIPWPFRTLAETYVRSLPGSLLGTGFNPWVCALVTRLA